MWTWTPSIDAACARDVATLLPSPTDPIVQRRLVEEQRDVPAVQRVGGRRQPAERAVRLELRGDLEAALEIRRIEIENRQEVFSCQRGLGHGCSNTKDTKDTKERCSISVRSCN